MNKMDDWDKIAAEIDATSFDDEAGWNERSKRASSSGKTDTEQSPDKNERASKSSGYLVQYDDVDKMDDDYDARSKYREKSVWNNGEWARDQRDARDQRGRDAAPRGDSPRRFDGPGPDAFDDRRPYYRSERPDDRPRRPSRSDGGFERASGRRPDGYRQDGYRDDDYYRGDGRRQEYGRRDDNYRDDNYRDDAYRNDGYRDDGYRDDGRRNDGYRERGGYREDGYRERDDDYRRRMETPPFRDSDRRGAYRSPDRDDASSNYRPSGRRYGVRDIYRGEYSNDYRDDGRRSRGYGDRPESLEPTIGARGKRGEPLSLAEELAASQTSKSRFAGRRRDDDGRSNLDGADAAPSNEVVAAASSTRLDGPDDEGANEMDRQILAEIEQMSPRELVAEARRQNVDTREGERRRELIVNRLRARLRENGLMYGEGTLEILPDAYGFLRSPDSRYLSCPDDIYISPSQIRRFGLRNGLTIFGQIRPPKERERYFALLRVETINDEDPNVLASKPFFDDLPAARPSERIAFETSKENLDERILDLLTPLGFGQRGLIVAPPRAGTTTLLQKMARGVLANYPDRYVFIVLVDDRPEEITEMERRLSGPRCEIVGSTFDETSTRHVQIADVALEKAKRMVEYGRHVVFFLDSLTRLTRALNAGQTEPGGQVPSTPDANALQRAKKYFNSARQTDGGGSLTIVATARVGAGGQFDEDVLEAFKGAGNVEIWLDRALAEKRVWPALNVAKSGAGREESILGGDEYRRLGELRRRLSAKTSEESLTFLRDELAKTENNAEFLASFEPDQTDA